MVYAFHGKKLLQLLDFDEGRIKKVMFESLPAFFMYIRYLVVVLHIQFNFVV